MERAPGAAQGHSASIHPHLLRACRSFVFSLSGPNQVYIPAADRATHSCRVMQLVWRNTRCFMYLGVCGSLFISRCSRKVGIKSGEPSVLRPNESSMCKRRYIVDGRNSWCTCERTCAFPRHQTFPIGFDNWSFIPRGRLLTLQFVAHTRQILLFQKLVEFVMHSLRNWDHEIEKGTGFL
jgi:hypothetical protein